MTDLNFSIVDKSFEEIAKYFNYTVEQVQEAVRNNAKTYQDVYNFVEKVDSPDLKENEYDYLHKCIQVYKADHSEVTFWYQNKRITKEEHDKLTSEEIRANNDLIRDYTK